MCFVRARAPLRVCLRFGMCWCVYVDQRMAHWELVELLVKGVQEVGPEVFGNLGETNTYTDWQADANIHI